MSHRERIERAIALKEVDRLPWSMWKHCHNIDRFPRKLAEYTLMMQRELDLDFVKFIPYGQVQCVDWGLDLRQSPSDLEQPRIVGPVIKTKADWDKIVPRNGWEGEYAVILEAQRGVTQDSLVEVRDYLVANRIPRVVLRTARSTGADVGGIDADRLTPAQRTFREMIETDAATVRGR